MALWRAQRPQATKKVKRVARHKQLNKNKMVTQLYPCTIGLKRLGMVFA